MATRIHIFVVSFARHVVDSSVFVARFIAFHVGPLLIHLCYFVILAVLGFFALVVLKPSNPAYSPRCVDMFFLSTSAVTVTGLASVRMEDLSSSQIAVLTLLMLLGSEMFVSLLGLALELCRQVERRDLEDGRAGSVAACDELQLEEADPAALPAGAGDHRGKKSRLKLLGFVLLAYMAMVLAVGSLLVFFYTSRVSSARDVLSRKGINVVLFSVSVTVSSFTNGGLLPTNESMAVFASNQGLLLLLAGQILAGNTLLPVFLKLVVSALRGLEVTGAGSEELELTMAEKRRAVGSSSLLLPSSLEAASLAATVAALVAAAATLFCYLDWDSAVLAGLSTGEKITNALFMAVNARQAGENSVDCSLIAPAALLLLVAMMYIPASTTLFSARHGGGERKDDEGKKTKTSLINATMLFSPLACNAALTVLVCVTERASLSADPLNFSTFNMIFEVISAYGNVGLSTGYSCSRMQQRGSICRDEPYSFSGWWSDEGKVVLVLVMLYGRLRGLPRHRS